MFSFMKRYIIISLYIVTCQYVNIGSDNDQTGDKLLTEPKMAWFTGIDVSLEYNELNNLLLENHCVMYCINSVAEYPLSYSFRWHQKSPMTSQITGNSTIWWIAYCA